MSGAEAKRILGAVPRSCRGRALLSATQPEPAGRGAEDRRRLSVLSAAPQVRWARGKSGGDFILMATSTCSAGNGSEKSPQHLFGAAEHLNLLRCFYFLEMQFLSPVKSSEGPSPSLLFSGPPLPFLGKSEISQGWKPLMKSKTEHTWHTGHAKEKQKRRKSFMLGANDMHSYKQATGALPMVHKATQPAGPI